MSLALSEAGSSPNLGVGLPLESAKSNAGSQRPKTAGCQRTYGFREAGGRIHYLETRGARTEGESESEHENLLLGSSLNRGEDAETAMPAGA